MKLVVLVRQDLKLPKGKLSTQVGHASVEAAMNSDNRKVQEWLSQGGKKIVLKVKDKKELFNYLQLAQNSGLKTTLIKDAGKTEVEPGTITCLGIGPDEDEKIDKVTGELKLV